MAGIEGCRRREVADRRLILCCAHVHQTPVVINLRAAGVEASRLVEVFQSESERTRLRIDDASIQKSQLASKVVVNGRREIRKSLIEPTPGQIRIASLIVCDGTIGIYLQRSRIVLHRLVDLSGIKSFVAASNKTCRRKGADCVGADFCGSDSCAARVGWVTPTASTKANMLMRIVVTPVKAAKSEGLGTDLQHLRRQVANIAPMLAALHPLEAQHHRLEALRAVARRGCC